MGKSDSFFIRAKTSFDGTNFNQSSIDLGAYVDALGKSVLRIHNVAVQYGDFSDALALNPNANAGLAFQLTTQSQTAIVGPTDKSIISTGALRVSADATQALLLQSETSDINPQRWTNGYLVGVEQIYLGVDQTFNFGYDEVYVVLECTVETLTQAGAMALALSQQ